VVAQSNCGIALQLIPSATALPDQIATPQFSIDPDHQQATLILPANSIDPTGFVGPPNAIAKLL
jgi:hypothetical protein